MVVGEGPAERIRAIESKMADVSTHSEETQTELNTLLSPSNQIEKILFESSMKFVVRFAKQLFETVSDSSVNAHTAILNLIEHRKPGSLSLVRSLDLKSVNKLIGFLNECATFYQTILDLLEKLIGFDNLMINHLQSLRSDTQIWDIVHQNTRCRVLIIYWITYYNISNAFQHIGRITNINNINTANVPIGNNVNMGSRRQQFYIECVYIVPRNTAPSIIDRKIEGIKDRMYYEEHEVEAANDIKSAKIMINSLSTLLRSIQNSMNFETLMNTLLHHGVTNSKGLFGESEEQSNNRDERSHAHSRLN